MRMIRSIMQSRSFLTRTLIGVAVTLGIIIGLLAMHTMSGDRGHGPAPVDVSLSAEMHTGAVPHHTGKTELESCDCGTGDPADGHSMLATACVLGLLITVLVLAIPVGLGRLHLRESLLGLAIERAGRAMARARPPSLYVLSISRT